ncbi:MAG: alpha/beta fold hydrolase [Candidatus Aminicenantes bacterium]|nr:alpha/beta fold hydrolase [Candidatus Aminicenantes bacterium]NIM77960.1 alpha/beta fold hydrolase [Candidatus Aminicenantes bacterium]NIN17289.1 alpha/beta fold hydrolase [Candidatus Aminicenantes bacterium]NIN41180.1 alpha/beta fold hydrolase [Candidatus Aminicenantes bacterium]NIN83957.1 alpha/beta fold hydrolase [Candidatus Aminicenantes bacterium]
MSTKLQWYKLMRLLSSNYLVIAIDLYGHGDSPSPPNKENFSLSDEVAFVESLLTDLIRPDESFHLVGHSYGGAVSLRFAYKSEERIRSLTLFEPVAYHLLPETEEILTQIRQRAEFINKKIAEGKVAEAGENFIDFWSGAGTFSSFPDAIKEMLYPSVIQLSLTYKALLNEPLSLEDYSKFKLPVCLMAGRQSPPDSRRVAELLAENLSNCQFKWISYGHMAPIYQTEEVNPIIDSFIRRFDYV